MGGWKKFCFPQSLSFAGVKQLFSVLALLSGSGPRKSCLEFLFLAFFFWEGLIQLCCTNCRNSPLSHKTLPWILLGIIPVGLCCALSSSQTEESFPALLALEQGKAGEGLGFFWRRRRCSVGTASSYFLILFWCFDNPNLWVFILCQARLWQGERGKESKSEEGWMGRDLVTRKYCWEPFRAWKGKN